MKIKNTFLGAIVLGILLIFSYSFTLGYSSYQYPKPDLTITDIESNQNVTSTYIDLVVRVANNGVKSSRKSWVGIYVGETFKRSCSVPALNPYQKVSLVCRYYFSSQEKLSPFIHATFFVDDMEEIWESDETNNKQSFDIPTHKNISTVPYQVSYQQYQPTSTVTDGPIVLQNYSSTPQISAVQVAYSDTESACATCFAQHGPTHIQQSHIPYFQGNLYQYDPNAKVYSVKTSENRVACPYGTNRLCFKAITYGKNNVTGECKEFPTTCLPLTGWTRVARCDDTSSSVEVTNYSSFITQNDEHFAVYNGHLQDGQLIEVNQGDKVVAEVALMKIDNTKRNFVYQNISNNFSLDTIEFPEGAVRCWTNRKTSGTTVYCRGQQPNTSIQYRLTARGKGLSPIFTRVQYDLDGQKIERQGTQNFQIN